MKTKIKLLLPMIALTLAAFSTAPKPALACSGDDCGCGLAAHECIAECPPYPDPAHGPCVNECTHEDIVCSKACCL